jgi:hypothetical protein
MTGNTVSAVPSPPIVVPKCSLLSDWTTVLLGEVSLLLLLQEEEDEGEADPEAADILPLPPHAGGLHDLRRAARIALAI